MSAIRRCALAKLRRGLWGVVAVALLIGLAGGAVLAALAGARRTETAAPRVWDRAAIADVDLAVNTGFSSPDAPRIAKLPQVRDFSFLQGFLIGAGEHGGPAPATVDPAKSLVFLASPDGHFGTTFNRFRDIPGFRGRMPAPDRVDEVAVSPTAARALGARPGSRVHAVVATLDTSTFEVTGTKPIDLTVVGIIVQPNELLTTANQESPIILGTPAFAKRFADQVVFGAAEVQLRDPERDLPAFEAGLHREFPEVTFNVRPARRDLAVFSRAVRPHADALRIFAVVAALTGLLIVAQALVRVVRADSVDQRSLWAAGVTSGQRGAIAVTRAWISVVAGACLAVAVAFTASPLFPLGLARKVEAERSLAFDGPVLLLGVAAIVVVLAGAAAAAAWSVVARVRRVDESTAGQRSRAVERLARAGASPSAVVGVRFAYQRSGNGSSGSLATALFGLVAAITAMGAALTFGHNLDHFVGTPGAYGWTWSALVEGINGFDQAHLGALSNDTAFTGVTAGTRGAVSFSGQLVDTYGLKRVRGDTGPVATKGRLPGAPDQVALGAQTLRDLHRSVGDTVATTTDGQQLRMRIVGRTLLPALSQATALGAEYGAVVPMETLYKLNPDSDGVVEFALVDLRRGTNLADLRRRMGAERVGVSGPSKPGDIRSYERVSSTPLLLVALLAILGVGVLVHLLITSVRGRRRDLAILMAVGFARRQVRATIWWQATALVVLALVVGIPLGIGAGQWAWRAFASYLGANVEPGIPVLPFVIIPLATVAIAIAISTFPARAAARTRPAIALAVE